ncbi:MAG: hypothetical protein HYX68_07925 [Planctomycetes bacterium]|nr:hypothetical protein [Planctomycetota bacterium]
MKTNLLIASVLVVLAVATIGVILALPFINREEDPSKTVKPRPEPIVALKKEKSKRPVKKEPVQVAVLKKKPDGITPPPKKTVEPEPKKQIETKVPEKKPDEKKTGPKKDDKQPALTKVLILGENIRLRDPDGDFTLKPLNKGKAILLGKVKRLTIEGINNQAHVDTTELEVEEIVFTGAVNGGSVKLGSVKTLHVAAVNAKAVLDASASAASEVVISGNVNSASRVMLSAPAGKVLLHGEINGGAQVEINAPGGKVRVRSDHATIVNGDSKLTIHAKDVELLGAINGTRTEVIVTISSGGSLKFLAVNGGSRLHYRKALRSDPSLRIDAGTVAPTAQAKEMPATK